MAIGKRAKQAFAVGAITLAATGIFGCGKKTPKDIKTKDKIENPIDKQSSIRKPDQNPFLGNLFLLMIPGVKDGITPKQFKKFTEIEVTSNPRKYHCIFKMKKLDKILKSNHPLKQSHDYKARLKKGFFSYTFKKLINLAHQFGQKVDVKPKKFLTNMSVKKFYGNKGKDNVLSSKVASFLSGIMPKMRLQIPRPGRMDMKKHFRNQRRSTGSM